MADYVQQCAALVCAVRNTNSVQSTAVISPRQLVLQTRCVACQCDVGHTLVAGHQVLTPTAGRTVRDLTELHLVTPLAFEPDCAVTSGKLRYS